MRNRIRTLVLAVLVCPFVVAAPPVAAAGYPERPIMLIVPWPAGGATDVVLRDMAQVASRQLGQPIVIENKPGVAGTLGPGTMARTAKPDGYTISQVAVTQFRLPHMQPVNYDPIGDFTYILRLTGYTFGVVVRSDSPWKTWQEFITHVKANPGKVNYGSVGIGSSQHIAMHSIGEAAALDWTHVPFKGSADALNSLLGGHVDAVADSAGWAPHVNSGKLRLLVTFGGERTRKWPGVPTLRELGLDLVFDSPYGLAGPKGMDEAVVRRLHDAFRAALADPVVVATLERLDQAERYQDTAAYNAYVRETFRREGEMINKLGLSAKGGK